MRVLVVNVGSSSLKLTLLDEERTAAARTVPAGAEGLDVDELTGFCRGLEVDAVGHRVVHGGDRFSAPVVVDADVRRSLEELTELAPLYQPRSLAGIDALRDRSRRHRRWPASTPPSTAPCPPPRRRTRCPSSGEHGGGCVATASTACRTPGRRDASPS